MAWRVCQSASELTPSRSCGSETLSSVSTPLNWRNWDVGSDGVGCTAVNPCTVQRRPPVGHTYGGVVVVGIGSVVAMDGAVVGTWAAVGIVDGVVDDGVAGVAVVDGRGVGWGACVPTVTGRACVVVPPTTAATPRAVPAPVVHATAATITTAFGPNAP